MFVVILASLYRKPEFKTKQLLQYYNSFLENRDIYKEYLRLVDMIHNSLIPF